ncbi:hypothetical protein HOY80DRAFT_1034257 [Tuber brumale]|nr:hypothetical protein HOY80DRAFT_1034257 [Tuber brumale]
MSQQVSSVKKQCIPELGQWKHYEVLTLLEDPDTMLAIHYYILKVGEKKLFDIGIKILMKLIVQIDQVAVLHKRYRGLLVRVLPNNGYEN